MKEVFNADVARSLVSSGRETRLANAKEDIQFLIEIKAKKGFYNIADVLVDTDILLEISKYFSELGFDVTTVASEGIINISWKEKNRYADLDPYNFFLG